MRGDGINIFFKGITPVISVILLLLITIAIVGFAMIFMQRSAASAAEESEEQLSKQTASLGENFEIININGNQVTVRNKGTAELKNLAFYVDGNKMTASGSSISKDGIGTFTLDAAQLAQYPGRKLKVSSAGMSKEETADFYKANTVAYYTFDSTDGREITDDSGNGNKGTFSGESWNDGTLKPSCPNCPQQTTGKYGNALSFDGSDDYVDAGNPASLTFTTEDFTIEMWIKPNVMVTSNLFSKGTDVASGYWLGFMADGRLYLATAQPGAQQTTNSAIGDITAGSWVHVAATRSGAVGKLYKNGVDITASSQSHINPGSAAITAKIGRHGTAEANYFNGAIDEVRIYNRALSQSEIVDDMNSPYPIDRPVASYSFGKIEGGKALDTHNVVKGRYGSALSFDGVNDYVNVPDSASLDLTNEIAIEAWVYPYVLPSGVKALVAKSYRDPYAMHIMANGAGLYSSLTFSDSSELAYQQGSNTQYSSGQWHNFATSFDSSNGRIKWYQNGVNKDTQTNANWAKTLKVTAADLLIGASTPAAHLFNGVIDEVRILNKAIS